jgi:hypothetical protein
VSVLGRDTPKSSHFEAALDSPLCVALTALIRICYCEVSTLHSGGYNETACNNRSEILNQPERKTMLKLVPLIPDSGMDFLKQSNCLATAARPFFSTCHFPLCPSKFSFSPMITSRVRNRRASCESREVFQSKVNADCVVQWRQGLGVAVNRKARVPLATLALDRGSFNRASHRTVQLDFDLSDALNAKPVAVQLDAVAVTGERDAIETPTRLKSREASFLLSLYPKKERFVGLVHAAKDVLAARKIRQTQVTSGTNLLQLVGLRVVVDRNSLLPRVATFLQRAVVEAAGFCQLPVENIGLEMGRE